MATFHCEIKSGLKGSAEAHAIYIARQGRHSKRGDLLFAGYGNLPSWSADEPRVLWKASDRYERANGTGYREWVIALPRELALDALKAFVERTIAELVGDKPYQYAVHAPASSLEGEVNLHLHLMYSDRMPDGIERPAERMFSRHNAKDPAKGGCKKDCSGRSRQQVSNDLVSRRQIVADLQNEFLEKSGHSARVDHRSLVAQGMAKSAERHLGPARINRMTSEEKFLYVSGRKARKRGDCDDVTPRCAMDASAG